ncbi:Hsp20/alpha crystallin family protein, partial [Bosea sp. (in: a-proteobacteria)]|uniref:Hsp20/alpha crystallin family protein n=1 Tax=Bosea sp. (in: a-proteobacteria) TaxID=1871050 RepID=UPI004033744C
MPGADAPGFSPEQVHVELQGDTLVVSGEKKSSRQDKHEEGGVKTHRRERTVGGPAGVCCA